MRTSNQFAARGPRLRTRRLAAGLIAVGLFVAACGSPPPSVEPATPRPTPVVTPNPHLTDPAAANSILLVMAKAKLPILPNNAAAGTDPVKVINATYAGWPMLISEYKSSATLTKAKPWTEGDPPVAGDAPVSIVGLNILIVWGPTVQGKPPKLDATQVAAMNLLIKTLDPYLGPLLVRSSSPLDVPAATPSPTPKASPSAAASAKPSAKPSTKPKPSPKPSKKPKD